MVRKLGAGLAAVAVYLEVQVRGANRISVPFLMMAVHNKVEKDQCARHQEAGRGLDDAGVIRQRLYTFVLLAGEAPIW